MSYLMPYIEDYKVIYPSTKFEQTAFKSIEYLDISLFEKYSFFQKRGFRLFHEAIKIIPSDLPILSYLDLGGCCYIKKIKFKDLPYQISPRSFTLLEGDIEFRSIIRTFIYYSRLHDIKEYYAFPTMNSEFPLCGVLLCFLHGLDYRLNELLKYGYQRINTSKMAEIYRKAEMNPVYEVCSVIVNLHSHGLYINLPDPHWDAYSLHRAFLVIEMMHVLCKLKYFSGHLYINWKRCCRLLWRSIPDPYLSLEEIHFILYELVWEDPFFMIEEMSQSYEDLFPDISMLTIRPRPLSHLSRCVIREFIRRSYSLPEGIDRLEIPLCLKSFLKLES